MLALEMQEGLLAEENRCLQRLETARILPELVDQQEERPALLAFRGAGAASRIHTDCPELWRVLLHKGC